MLLRRLTVLLLLTWVALAAQETPPKDIPKAEAAIAEPQEKPPVFRANIRLLLVDVIATVKGKPITDLKAGDFTVVHNGKKQPLAVFESVGVGARTARAAKPGVLIRPGAITNVPTEASTAPVTVLLMDSINTPPASQAHARRAFLKAIQDLPKGQHVMAFYLGRELRLLVDDSGDKNKIAAIFDGSSTTQGTFGGAPAQVSGAQPVSSVGASAQGSPGNLSSMVEAAVEQVEKDLATGADWLACEYTQDGLQALAKVLRRLPGRKKLVWMSENFPLACNERGPRTLELFAMARIAIYPVNAGGLETATLGASEKIFARDHPERMQRQRTGAQAEKTLGMMRLANDTGGLHYQNNDLAGSVGETFTDGTQYYTLGFYANKTKPTLTTHQVEVKTRRRGVNLRYRSYYVFQDFEGLSPKQRSNEFGAALNLGTPISTELLFAAELVKQPGGLITVVYRVAADKLRFSVDDAGGTQARVDCAAEAYDGRGKSIQQRAQTVESSMARDTLADVMQVGFPCEVGMTLAPGDYVLRLGVRDSHTGALGTAQGSISIP
jgi:VWFA-related protein